ncbi:Hypothetical protein precursor [Flavobacterium indicum GPTSA100-9 = DSM 17447]|uniref:Disease resistance R13L4/SHOC-2-like LRR domain-containing protein n=1 Tax=Flavobacterium indicum (strain DSM 17447 / CIP 109464 / GPTSA100-9) TaxID=1094466 RepID=H8XV27_FLAIG|nr:hypothetical protein [Flavobacterium indicum]CCG52997.1 Hypothetical protein precursor [Flavobacterium indicum GPTSA100-9 = DSM 17447]
MKQLIFLLLLSFSSLSFAQCVKCTSLEEATKEPLKVKSLQLNSYLTEEEISDFPKEIEKMTNLEILYFTDFEITEIPDFIGNLRELKSISFSGTTIKSLPSSLLNLKKLKELILFNTSIPNEFLVNFEKQLKVDIPSCKILFE